MSELNCPHCGGEGKIRTSRAETTLVRNLTVHCKDPSCGHRYIVMEERRYEVLYTLEPSRRPNPAVNLPGAYWAHRVKLNQPANDAGPGGPEVPRPPAANDDGQLDAALG